jgi:hypothetical protein
MKCVTLITFINVVSNDARSNLNTVLLCINEMKWLCCYPSNIIENR